MTMMTFVVVHGILLLSLIPANFAQEDPSPSIINVDEDAELLELAISMTAVAGGKVLLPCNITPPSADDDVALILWYKDESKSPLYSIDGRRSSIHRAHRFVAESLRERAFLDTAVHPAILQIEELLEKDEGVYRCRVDFKKARTRNSDIILNILVPPKKPIIMDTNGEILQSLIGPFNEGDPLVLICDAEGGKPAPSVTWWRESVLLDDTFETTLHGVVRNELAISNLKRSDLMAVFTCLATNNNISVPSSSAVTVDMNFKPQNVHIENKPDAMSAGKSVDIICRSKGSRPPALITWWKGSNKMTRTKDRISINGYVTTSVLTLIPNSDDHMKYLTCRAVNTLMPGDATEDGFKLEVHYIPQLNLRLGSKLNQDSIQESNDVYFECNIRANPWVTEIGWKFGNKELLTNVTHGIIVSNQSLVLQKVNRAHRGYYTCTGTNTEGQGESNRVFLRVQYTPVCKGNQKTVYGVARHESVKVYCEVDADPEETTFRWEFNNSMETTDVIRAVSDGSQSIATYIPRSENDYGTLLCWARNAVGAQQEPCVYSIIPAGPPDPPENCTFSNKTENSLAVECVEGYDGGLPQFFVMEVHDSGQHRVRANVSTDVPLLAAGGLPPGTAFVLVVYSVNIKGRSQSVILRASTMPAPVRHTQREAMWQFNMSPVLLVLIGVVLLLVLLAILIVAIMKEKSRRGKLNVETQEALTYDNLKKQSNSKDAKDKIFTYSMQEEKCPDIIPEANAHVSGGAELMRGMESDHVLWKTPTKYGLTEAHISLNSVCYGSQSPEKATLRSMTIQDYYNPGLEKEELLEGAGSLSRHRSRGSSSEEVRYFRESGALHSTFQPPPTSSVKPTASRNNPVSLGATSPPRRESENLQTEV